MEKPPLVEGSCIAQSARMTAVGEITAAQETTVEMCADAVRRAERLTRPGVRPSELHQAALSNFSERLMDGTTENRSGTGLRTRTAAHGEPGWTTYRTRTTSGRVARYIRLAGPWVSRPVAWLAS